ncbi:uncharacterized protein LTR77_005509 [Saxophila tyrrhenica]|uniref:Ataxin-10 n=1 Tax=Saxophila tyrrhenica TaxID=1690608 RepID=A0AAV9P9H4_9PEZI|nr:hypothetical protein LTR77_005509 [Saxophila tyrrhenica]
MSATSSSPDLDDLESAFSNLTTNATPPRGLWTQFLLNLAAVSRENIQVREKIGRPRVLQGLIAFINDELESFPEGVEAALRCIGNACIDNDTVRQHVTDLHFRWAVRCLEHSLFYGWRLANLTVKVLYNICLDFAPASEQCYRDGVPIKLITLCYWNACNKLEDPLAIELLFWTSAHLPNLPDSPLHIGSDTLLEVLRLPPAHYRRLQGDLESPSTRESQDSLLSIDNYSMLLETTCTFLRDEQVQRGICQSGVLSSDLWALLYCNEEYMDVLCAIEVPDEEIKLLMPLSTSLTWILSDISAKPEFVASNDVRSDWVKANVIERIAEWRGFNNRLYTAACQVLGNMLWVRKDQPETPNMRSVEEDVSWLVEQREIQRGLFQHIYDASRNPDLLHSAAGLLLQLARPSARVREEIVNSEGAESSLDMLCRHENQQIQQDGIKLLRALGQDNAAVQQRFAELAQAAVAKAAANAEAANADGDAQTVQNTEVPG